METIIVKDVFGNEVAIEIVEMFKALFNDKQDDELMYGFYREELLKLINDTLESMVKIKHKAIDREADWLLSFSLKDKDK